MWPHPGKDYNTMTKTTGILQQLLEDGDFRCKFCHGCDARYFIPGNRIEPGEESCPSDFEIDDPKCQRHRRWERIVEAIEDAVEIPGEEEVA
jgi:hypothetical protein